MNMNNRENMPKYCILSTAYKNSLQKSKLVQKETNIQNMMGSVQSIMLQCENQQHYFQ